MTQQHVVVGCPVYERAWVLEKWFSAVESWTDVTVEYVFAYTPSKDETYAWLTEHTDHIYEVTEGAHGKERDWANPERIRTLANMRNLLLDKVADMEFDFYFSLDSDIIVPPDTFNPIYGHMRHMERGAISPTVQLAKDHSIINAFVRRRDGYFTRMKPGYEGRVDVIAAAKLMCAEMVRDPAVRYDYHPLGEDFAWSNAATKAGYPLYLSREKAKHYMDRRESWTTAPY